MSQVKHTKKTLNKTPSKTKKAKNISCPSIGQHIKNKKLKFIGKGEGGIVFRLNNIGNVYALKFSIADDSYPFDKNHPANIEDSILKEIEKLRLKNISPSFNPYSGSTKCGLETCWC